MAIDTDDEKLALIGLHMPFEDTHIPMGGSIANDYDLLQLLYEYPSENIGGAPAARLSRLPLLGVG